MGGIIRRNQEDSVDAGTVYPPKQAPASPVRSGEGSEWFWRIFGGTILGAITFLLVTLLNHLNANIDGIRTQQIQWQKEVAADVISLRDRLVKVEEGIAGIKEANKELNLTALKDRVSTIEQVRELDKERKVMSDERLKTLEEEVKALRLDQAKKEPEPPKIN